MKQSSVTDYYAGNTKRKVVDFLIGFFVPIVLMAVVITGFLTIVSQTSRDYGGIGVMLLGIPIILIIALVLGILFFNKLKRTRRYIAIGILVSTVLPILIYGSCWVVLGLGNLRW